MQILDAEQDLIEESLEYEKKQLDAEREWEFLRLKREKEAEEEMKEQIRLKEDELIEELKRLGEEKDNKDEENNNLREQLKVKIGWINISSDISELSEQIIIILFIK